MFQFDRAAVLGAGIVGISCAIELKRRGFAVTLIDRRGPAAETSWGNAGVISRASIFPNAGPALWRQLPRRLANRGAEVHVHYRHLPAMLPWLVRFLARCNRRAREAAIVPLDALAQRALDAHRTLMDESDARGYLRETGWLKVFRHGEPDPGEIARMRRCGIGLELVDEHGVGDLEPDLAPIFGRGIWIRDTAWVTNPGAVARRYAARLRAAGAELVEQPVHALDRDGDIWKVRCDGRTFDADVVVVALGAWSAGFLRHLGYRVPLIAERGYHCLFEAAEGRTLRRPVYDVDTAYVVSPMETGHRLSTGIEWAPLDSPPTPRQLQRVLPKAREAMPLGRRLQDEPWMGNRPATPDSLPFLGPAPRHRRLWFAFGHGAMGFGMGPVSGRLVAAAVTGEEPDIDPAPFAPDRFRI